MAKEACLVASGAIKNTGSECDTALGPIKMLLMGDTSIEFTEEDLEDFLAWVLVHIHAAGKQRVYPLFGNRAEIWETTSNDESAVTATSPDTGIVVYIRTGAKNLTFSTTAGGLCFAEALNSMGKANLGFIPFDKDGQFIVKKNANGTYGFFKATSSPQSPIFAVANTPYQNRFSISFNPDTFVQLGKTYADEAGVLDEEGLYDVVLESRAAATTTSATIGGYTDCAKSELYDTFGAATGGSQLRAPSAWSVYNVTTAASVTVTGVTGDATNKAYVLAFAAQTSADVLRIGLAASDVLYGLDVAGIEGSDTITVTIP